MRVSRFLKPSALVSPGAVFVTSVVVLSLSGAASAQQLPPPSAWPVLEVANPSPGDVVSNGAYVISGSAFDPAAVQGSGVSRVDLFLGDRDQGGIFLGSAVPGQDAVPGLTPGSALAQDSFQVTVTLPSSVSGGQDFFAYAYSSLTGDVTAVSMPIFVGVAPTPVATPAPQPVAQVDHLLGSQRAGADMLSLGNPSASDVLQDGDYVVSGATGSGIDRVQLFLDDRDTGGTLLGTAIPTNGSFTVTVTIPTSASGAHNFTAYASSSATGQETKVSVPIYIGAAPTPTPRPTS